MSTMYEQETTVTSSRGDDFIHIYTANPFHIARLEAEDRAERVKGDIHGDEPWASYRVSASDWNPLGGFKRRMSDDARQALSDRMKALHGS